MKKMYLLMILIISSRELLATTYYMSNTGNDSNTGTSTAEAWKTIEKLNSMLSGLVPGDRVLFNRGDVFAGEIIIPSGVNGNANAPVVFGSYGTGNKPVISGSISVTGWVQYATRIWKAPLAYNKVLQVFENHNRLICARTPNKGYYRIGNIKNNEGFTDPKLGTSVVNSWKNASLLFHLNEFWWEDAVIDSSHTSGYIEFTYGSSGFNPLIPGSGYFIQNKLELLDTLNEWYFDSTAHALYLYSTDDPSGKNITASVQNNGIQTNWPWINAYITVENIEFREQNENAIQLRGSEGLTVRGCDIYNVGQYGLLMSSDYASISRLNQISNNHIENCLANGIYTFNIARSILTRNVILKSGLYPAPGGAGEATGQSAMRLWYGDSLSITYNRIDSSGNCGINVESSYNLLEKNIVDHSMLLLSDGGAIYNNVGSHNIFRNNLLRYTKGDMEAGAAGAPRYTKELYFDAAGDTHSIIENNTMVSYADNAGIGLTPNTNHMTIRNNVIYQCLRSLEIFNYDPLSQPINALEVVNNTFYANRKDAQPYYINTFAELKSMFSRCDSNYLCNPYTNVIADHLSLSTDKHLDFAQWKSQSQVDEHSKSSYFRWSYPADSSFIIMNETDTAKTHVFQVPVTDLNNHLVSSVTLPPFSSKILIKASPADTLPTTIHSAEKPPLISVFPNPASDLLYIQIEKPLLTDQKITMTDLTGKPVFENIIQSIHNIIDLSGLKDGIYILKIGEYVEKVVVQH